MRTGRVVASLPECSAEMGLPFIAELIARKKDIGDSEAGESGDRPEGELSPPP